MYETSMYEGMLAETIAIPGFEGDMINAYFARPLGPGPFPSIVLIHHMPGWDEWYREATRKFAHHGYAALSPNLYFRDGQGTPEDVAANNTVYSYNVADAKVEILSKGTITDSQRKGWFHRLWDKFSPF